VKGYIDRSQLFLIEGENLERFSLTEPLTMGHEAEVVHELMRGEKWDFMGLEDPDIWIDEDGLTHLYFTIPFVTYGVNLGHAVGKDIDSLVMTEPALTAGFENEKELEAKEVSIAPINSQGVRLNLVESSIHERGEKYSTVRVAIARDMNKPWEYGDTVFHPAEHKLAWIGGHASPGPLLPRSFIDVGEHKLVGIMNGREANTHIGKKIEYGTFSIGLFIYDYENGNITWVSPEPLIRDTEAKIITFASHFVDTGASEGILYAHVDDSFVRAYTLYAEGIRALLP
jgi:hypothetical protein